MSAANGQRILHASIGKHDPQDSRSFADITKCWTGKFSDFVTALSTAPVVADKAAAGWVCGAEFKNNYRHGDTYVASHFVSLDYDHIQPSDVEKILAAFKGTAHHAYTTHSHTPEKPRMRVWLPLSRPVNAEQYQAISRKAAARAGIELAARESFTPCQLMFRPAAKDGIPFQSWSDTESPHLDVDAVLAEYENPADRAQWPRHPGEELSESGKGVDPKTKPGIIGDFCRAFTISAAIERFNLPYAPGSSADRWTYTAGSRADGAIIYDDDSKIHVHDSTSPANGQSNAWDLVRKHVHGHLDTAEDKEKPIGERTSQRAMEVLALQQPEVAVETARRQAAEAPMFEDLDAKEAQQPGTAPAVAAKGRKPLVFHKTPRDILTRKLPEQRFALYPWFPSGTVSLLAAMGGLGKSWLFLLMATYKALGLEFCGRLCTPGRVVLLTAEDDLEEVRRRHQKVLKYIVETCGVVIDWDLLDANFQIVDMVGGGAENMMVQALSKGFIPTDLPVWLADQIGPADLIAFDTKTRFASASDENDNAAGSAFVAACEIVANRTGAAITCLAHTGKMVAREGIVDQYSIRGASSLADDSRSVMVLTSVSEAQKKQYEFDPGALELPDPTIFRMVHTKHNRSKKAPDVFLQRADNGTVSAFAPKMRQIVSEQDRTWRLLSYVGTGEIKSQRVRDEYEAIFGAGVTRDAAGKLYLDAISKGLLVYTRNYNRADYYKLSDDALKELAVCKEAEAAAKRKADAEFAAWAPEAEAPDVSAEPAPKAEEAPAPRKPRKPRKTAAEPAAPPQWEEEPPAAANGAAHEESTPSKPALFDVELVGDPAKLKSALGNFVYASHGHAKRGGRSGYVLRGVDTATRDALLAFAKTIGADSTIVGG
jgi:hypothetical protein